MAALLIPGLVFFTALVLVAIANTQNVTTKSQTEAQGSILKFFKDAITGKAAVHAITQLTRAAISRWALAQLRPVTAWFVAFNALLLNIFRTQTDVMEGTADSLERLRRHTIPQAVGKAAAPAKAQARAANTRAAKAQATASATSTSLHKYRVTTAPKIAHATHAVDVTIPRELGRIRTQEDKLSSDAKALRERTTSLENGAVRTFEWIRTHPLSAVTGVFAAAVAVALQRMGFGFLRCRSWRSFASRLTCGMAGMLEELLFTAVTAFAALDICDFANAAQDLAEQFQPVLIGLVDVENALVGCHGATALPSFDLPPLHVPAKSLGLSLVG
jgi:hypothetical protein